MFPSDFYHLDYYFEFLADRQLGQVIQCWKEYQQQTCTGGVITTKTFFPGQMLYLTWTKINYSLG